IYTSLGIISILLVVFIGQSSIKYLKSVLRGTFPVSYIANMILLEVPYLLSLIIPLGFYLSGILVYTRMYAEQEMVVLLTSGMSKAKILFLSFRNSIAVCLCVAVFSLWLGPYGAKALNDIRNLAKSDMLSKLLIPGQFTSLDRGRKIIYIDNFTKDNDGNNLAHGIFIAEHPSSVKINEFSFDMILSENAKIIEQARSNLKYASLTNGFRYSNNVEKQIFRGIEFEKYITKIPSFGAPANYTESIMSLDEILNNRSGDERKKMAEFHWRISHPISVFTLILIAFSISRTEPRKGKYSKILPGILLYVGYYNLLFFGKNAIKDGTIDVYFGLWWVHIIFLILGITFFNFEKFKSFWRIKNNKEKTT
ncbi:MAG: LPS export ABC transporter permease LptF, partial [Legionellales bacterium]|nr:LPS export ABC transporter permease LptF [Legionellales bacterium]